jgi:hypothetical protein
MWSKVMRQHTIIVLALAIMSLISSNASANDALIYYNSTQTGTEYSRLKSHLESLGFTVTGSTSNSVSSSAVSGKELVIDMAGTSNCGSTCRSVYDSYVSGGGKLIIAAPAGASNRQSNIESLIENKMSVGTMTYYGSTASSDSYWQSISRGDYATSYQTTLPGAGQLFNATGGTPMASNSYSSVWHTWYKWDYGSNGGSIIVAMGYDQFQTNLTYTSNMTTFLTTTMEEEGLYSSTTTPTYSSAPTAAQTSLRTNTRAITHDGNGIYIDQIGDNLDLDIVQDGQDNFIAGTNSTASSFSNAEIAGNNNTVDIEQRSDDNGLLFDLDGNHNNLTVSQGNSISDGGGNRAIVGINGDYNDVSLTQKNGGLQNGQFADISVTGDSNFVSSQQHDSDQMLFVDITGSDSTLYTNQKDSGSHFLDITLGSDQTLSVTQEGSGNHAATIALDGYESSLQLNQNSSTSQTYSIDQTCGNANGCGTTVVTQN